VGEGGGVLPKVKKIFVKKLIGRRGGGLLEIYVLDLLDNLIKLVFTDPPPPLLQAIPVL